MAHYGAGKNESWIAEHGLEQTALSSIDFSDYLVEWFYLHSPLLVR